MVAGSLTESSVHLTYEPGPIYLPPNEEFITALDNSEVVIVPRRRLRTEGLGWLGWMDVDCPPPSEFSDGLDCVRWAGRHFIAMTDSEIAKEVANIPGAVGVTGSHQLLKSGLRPNVKTSSGGVVISDAKFVLACLQEHADDLKECMNAFQWGHLQADHVAHRVVSEYAGVAKDFLNCYPGLFEVHECTRDAELKLRLPHTLYKAAVVIRQTGKTMGHLNLASVCAYDNVRVTGVYSTDA